MNRTAKDKSNLAAGGLMLLLTLSLSLLGLKSFSAWPQVQELWESDVPPIFFAGHPHFSRFLITIPGFLLEQRLPNLGFSLYLSFFSACSAALLNNLSYQTRGCKPRWITWLTFCTMQLLMNGRGTIAWTAWLLCAVICINWTKTGIVHRRQLFLTAASLFLSTVSTGVFLITLGTFSYFYFLYIRSIQVSRALKIILTLLIAPPLLYLTFDYALVAISKNVEYFGGGLSGLISMLEHGAGSVFRKNSDVTLLVATALSPALATLVIMLLFGKRATPLSFLLAISVAGGAFGFTVLTLAIPIALIASQRRKSTQPYLKSNSIKLTTLKNF